MTTSRTEPPTEADQPVGGQPRTDVEQAFTSLEASAAEPQHQTQFARGAMAGYLWALGRGTSAPVTGAKSAEPPDLALLTAELDAAVVQLEDQTRRTVARDYTQGVQQALAWVCGYSHERP